MTPVERRSAFAPPRRAVNVCSLTPVAGEPELPRRGEVGVHDLWGASPAYPHVSDVADVTRWLAHLYAASASGEPRRAVSIVLWTIDTVLQERGGLDVLDAILARVDVGCVTSGVIVALVRGTHHTGARLPSRRAFLVRARGRLLSLGKRALVEGNTELVDLESGDDAERG